MEFDYAHLAPLEPAARIYCAMNDQDAVLVALRQIIRATDQNSKRLGRSTGLTVPQIVLMRAIAAHPDATLGFLTGQVSLSQATVSTIVDRLEERGLIRRQRNARDKRVVNVALTEPPVGAPSDFARGLASISKGVPGFTPLRLPGLLVTCKSTQRPLSQPFFAPSSACIAAILAMSAIALAACMLASPALPLRLLTLVPISPLLVDRVSVMSTKLPS